MAITLLSATKKHQQKQKTFVSCFSLWISSSLPLVKYSSSCQTCLPSSVPMVPLCHSKPCALFWSCVLAEMSQTTQLGWSYCCQVKGFAMQMAKRSATEVWVTHDEQTVLNLDFALPVVSCVCALPYILMVSSPTFLFFHSTSAVTFCPATIVDGWGCGHRRWCGVITQNESCLWGSAEGCRHSHLSC